MAYLMFFHIGPVQGFIGTARRTYDLWGGSWLLSELCKTAINSIKSHQENDIVYPVIPQTAYDDFANCPNKFMAVLHSPRDDKEALELAKNAQQAALTKFKNAAYSIKKQIENKKESLASDPVWNDIWKRQVENYFEIYWVIIPTKDDVNLKDKNSYSELLKKIQDGLNSRKLIRNFNQQIERGPRCSLCGTLEQLIISSKNNTLKDYNLFWLDLTKTLHTMGYTYTIREGERLCAICLTKRLLSKDFSDKIPSTSSIATSNVILRITELLLNNNNNTSKLKELLNTHLQNIEKLNLPKLNKSATNVPIVEENLRKLKAPEKDVLKLDGDAFIPDTFSVQALKKYTESKEVLNKDAVYNALQNLKKIYEILKEESKKLSKPFTPSKYIAVITADGDNVGKIMSGSKDTIDIETHKKLSKRFSDYANKVVRHAIEELHKGKIIYWGGDEGLALCCIEDLIDIMLYLRSGFTGQWRYENDKFIPDFSQEVSNKIKYRNNEDFAEVPGELTTLSIGAVIGHHQESLLKMIEEARDALEKAKRRRINGIEPRTSLDPLATEINEIAQKDYKDSFTITIIRRSGETTTFSSRYFINNLNALSTLKDLIQIYKSGFPDNWIYELKRELLTLYNLNHEYIVKEILRITSRRQIKNNHKSLIKEVNEKFYKILKESDKNTRELNYLIGINEIASYIAKGGGS